MSPPSHPVLPPPFQRVYFHHIRRVGGTSLNEAFYALSGADGETLRWALRSSDDRSLLSNGVRYVGANRALLEQGEYFYGSSHVPAHKVALPPNTFKIVILRDPVDRIISNYRMALHNASSGGPGPFISVERRRLGDSILDFCHNLPRPLLSAQLYAFSSSFDPREAAASIATYDAVLFTEEYDEGMSQLSTALGLNLTPRRAKPSPPHSPFSHGELRQLEGLLEREIELLELVRRAAGVARARAE